MSRGAVILVRDDRWFMAYIVGQSELAYLGQAVVRFIEGLRPPDLEKFFGLFCDSYNPNRREVEALDELIRSAEKDEEDPHVFSIPGRKSISDLRFTDLWQKGERITFLTDSRFCGWVYLLDFESREVEVYAGQAVLATKPPEGERVRGRFAEFHDLDRPDVIPVTLVHTVPFDEPELGKSLIQAIIEKTLSGEIRLVGASSCP